MCGTGAANVAREDWTAVGEDIEGRTISYDPNTAQLFIGGMSTTIERLEAMHGAGQLSWNSEEVVEWVAIFSQWTGRQNEERKAAELKVEEVRALQRRARRIRMAAGSALIVVIVVVGSLAWNRWSHSPVNTAYDYLEAEAANDWPAMAATMDMEAVFGRQFDREVAAELNTGADPAVLALAASLKPGYIEGEIARREQEVRAALVSRRRYPRAIRLTWPRPTQAGFVGDTYQLTMELRNPKYDSVRPITFTLANTDSGWRIIDLQE